MPCDSDEYTECSCRKNESARVRQRLEQQWAEVFTRDAGATFNITQPSTVSLLHPKLGQDVHYVSYGTPNGEYPSDCRAAKIVEVEHLDAGTSYTLLVFNPTGLHFKTARHDEGRGPGSFHVACEK